MKLETGQVLDRYTVERSLGHGGTALVYLVRHNRLGTQHALKVLTVNSDAIRSRMEREGQVQAGLRHPNIVLVSDILDVAGNPGLLMEYIAGPTLEDALKKFKFTMGDAEVLFASVVSAVKAAHRAGLVHRDLKPANILLERTKQGVVPKVTDFGLAKVLASDEGVHHTRSGIAMGTPSYMAPEQIRDARTVDERADIWSLGCLLYELICRRRAFPGDEALDIYNRVCSGTFEPPRTWVPDLPDRLEQAIHGAMRIDKDARIPDCDVLLDVMNGEREWSLTDDASQERTKGLDTPPIMSAPLPPRPEMQVAARKPTPARAVDRPQLGATQELGTGGPALGAGGLVAPGVQPLPQDHSEPGDPATVLIARNNVDGTLQPPDSLVDPSLTDESSGWAWGTGVLVTVLLVGLGLAAFVGVAGVLGGVVLTTGTAEVESSERTPMAAPTPGRPVGAPKSKAASVEAAPHPAPTPTAVPATPPAAQAVVPAALPALAPEISSAASGPSAAQPEPQPAVQPETSGVQPEPGGVRSDPSGVQPEPSSVSTSGAEVPSPQPADAVVAVPRRVPGVFPPRPASAPVPGDAPSTSDPQRDVAVAAAGADPDAATKPPPANAPSAAPTLQTVKLFSTPPTATVLLNGQLMGLTHLKLDIFEGRHAVLMRSGDQEGSFIINVEAGADNRWCYSFAQQTPMVGPCPPTIAPGTVAPTP